MTVRESFVSTFRLLHSYENENGFTEMGHLLVYLAWQTCFHFGTNSSGKLIHFIADKIDLKDKNGENLGKGSMSGKTHCFM